MKKISVNKTLLKAEAHRKKGQKQEALKLFKEILEEFPKNKRAQRGLAALNEQRHLDGANGRPEISIDKMVSLYNQGRYEELIRETEKIIEFFPNDFDVWNMTGLAYLGKANSSSAEEAFKRATRISPENPIGYNNLGIAFKEQGQPAKAIACFQKAISLKPDYAEAFNNMGIAQKFNAENDKALHSFQKAIFINPEYPEALLNIGATLEAQNKPDEAMECYQKALALNPEYAKASYNIGNIFHRQGNLEDAFIFYKQSVSKDPSFTDAYNNIGNVLVEWGRLDEAIMCYKKALSLSPSNANVASNYIYQLKQICDWSSLDEYIFNVESVGVKEGFAISPFTMLSLEDAPERHKLRSINFTKEKIGCKKITDEKYSHQRKKRLHIGYFSADFHNHATMYLMNQVFNAHDRSRFKVIAYSYGPEKDDEMRRNLLGNVDAFHDVSALSDRQLVEFIQTEKLDIAIDLKGFTKDKRLSPFSFGLAPIQISYLGYPGTLGAKFIDYIIADRVVVPDDKRQYYSENIIYLPNSYQPTDDTRVISDISITRAEVGLPESGFVFCCFNNNYKITAREFDIWMRLLGRIEGSVLWLVRSNKWSEKNLRREAEARGVSAARLVFADKVSQAEHLARQRLADLFLDTFNYNAHTTASDALWAGLPVVTKMGEGFAARVGGSLLTAVGLPELITRNEREYEALIRELAAHPRELRRVTKKLEENITSQPLFDSVKYTRNLEAGFEMAFDRYIHGKRPSDIIVPEQ